MNKFLFSAILEVYYREFLYVTYNYNKDTIGVKEINLMADKEFTDLKKSKPLDRIVSEILEYDLSDTEFHFDIEFLNIIKEKNYNKNTVSYIIDYLNTYIDYYNKVIHTLIDNVSETLDLKRSSEGYKGTYPLYIKISENNCLIERAVLSTNARNILAKETNKFTYKITFVDYDVPLKDYSYKGQNLKKLSRDEIVSLMNDSIKVNLSYAKYFETSSIEIEVDNNEIVKKNIGELSLLLDKKNETYSGIKSVAKDSLKRALIYFLVLAAITAIIFLIKYFNK